MVAAHALAMVVAVAAGVVMATIVVCIAVAAPVDAIDGAVDIRLHAMGDGARAGRQRPASKLLRTR